MCYQYKRQGGRMKKHKCVMDEGEIGLNMKTGEKDYFCKICQKKMLSIQVKK
jgi:hypothetical protein